MTTLSGVQGRVPRANMNDVARLAGVSLKAVVLRRVMRRQPSAT
jgi:hypothetical protein